MTDTIQVKRDGTGCTVTHNTSALTPAQSLQLMRKAGLTPPDNYSWNGTPTQIEEAISELYEYKKEYYSWSKYADNKTLSAFGFGTLIGGIVALMAFGKPSM